MTEAKSSSTKTLPERTGENGKGRFKTVNDVSQEVEALFEATYQRPRGSLIKHVEIEEITGYERMVVDSQNRLVPNAVYRTILKKWRMRLLDSKFGGERSPGIACIASPGVGLRFATVEEQETIVPDNLEKQARRKMRSARDVVDNIHESEMTETQKRYRQERLRQTKEALDLNRTHVEERKSYMATPDVLPRWNGGK